MAMAETIAIINAMEAAGVIGSYAVGGAVGAFNYVEVSFTEDLDILVSFEDQMPNSVSGLGTLAPIFEYLADRNFTEFRNEGIVVAGWPVQFLPVASVLDAEGLARAVTVELKTSSGKTTACRILRAEHLMATALDVGRAKDYARIIQFTQAGSFDPQYLCDVLERHNLSAKWRSFCDRFEIADPCNSKTKP